MTATIYDLRRAAGSPATHFRRLAAAVCEGEDSAHLLLCRDAHTPRRPSIYALHAAVGQRDGARRALAPLRRNLVSPVVPQMEILCDEMKYEDTLGREFTSDILIEALPQGLPLTDAIDAIDDGGDAARLVGAVDALERELRRARVSHNNLRADNILIDADGALYPVRWIYATDGAGGDSKSLDDLRTMIAQRGDAAAAEHAAFDPYGPAVEGTYGIGTLSEGLAPSRHPAAGALPTARDVSSSRRSICGWEASAKAAPRCRHLGHGTYRQAGALCHRTHIRHCRLRPRDGKLAGAARRRVGRIRLLGTADSGLRRQAAGSVREPRPKLKLWKKYYNCRKLKRKQRILIPWKPNT